VGIWIVSVLENTVEPMALSSCEKQSITLQPGFVIHLHYIWLSRHALDTFMMSTKYSDNICIHIKCDK
jgi:hypothetical protein